MKQNVWYKYKMSAKELKDKLKALRMAHSGKAVGKMTAEEIAAEIEHHETAAKARELKAKRMAALAAAREARAKASDKPKLVVKEIKKEKVEKVAEIPKKEFVKEHKKLIKVLESGSAKEQKKEAKEQKKEMKKVKYVADSDSEMSSTDDDTDQETIRSRIQKKKSSKDE